MLHPILHADLCVYAPFTALDSMLHLEILMTGLALPYTRTSQRTRGPIVLLMTT